MISKEILNKIYQLELKTRKLLLGQLGGDYRTLLKGSGFEFDQLRDYQPSDDIRFIDWKSSARANKMLVRQYLEDRNRILILVVDISVSTDYGSAKESKADVIKQVAGILAFAGLYAKDSIGLTLFSDQIELSLAARPSRSHVINLVSKLFTHKAKSHKTNINFALDNIMKMQKKKAVICLISDFLDEIDPKLLRIVAAKHELLAFRCLDKLELNFPKVSILAFADSETKQVINYNTSSKYTMGFENILKSWHNQQVALFKKSGVDCLTLMPETSISYELMRFLNKR